MKLRRTGLALAAAAALAGAVALVGCGGGSDDGPSGNSTVSGNVSSVVGGGAFYQPSEPHGGIAGLLAGIRNLFIGKAWAAVQGVSIRVAGTDLEATTADDGSFIISGVPGGEQTLIFSYGGTTASLVITVPDNATVRLSDVDVFNGSVDVGNVEVEINPDDDNGNTNANGNDNGDDDNDNGDDDNGNGDDNDDNGNSNDNDDNGNDNGDDDNDNEDNGNDNVTL